MEKKVKRLRITVVGPCFTGKTSIVNRIVNNSFITTYYPTSSVSKYKIAFNLMNESDFKTNYVQTEIVDVFPLDHPLLIETNPGGKVMSSYLLPDYDLNSDEMYRSLVDIINNDVFLKPTHALAKGKKDVPNREFSHAIVFVFDLSCPETLVTAIDYIKAFTSAENSSREEAKLKK